MKRRTFKKIQNRLGYTNEKMADALHVSVSVVEKWRSGERRITPRTAQQIELFLKVNDFDLEA